MMFKKGTANCIQLTKYSLTSVMSLHMNPNGLAEVNGPSRVANQDQPHARAVRTKPTAKGINGSAIAK
jgi:hypothetical protein